MCFAAYVSTRNFTCLREIILSLIGWTLVKRWRNLTVARFFEWQQQNSANRQDGDPHRLVTSTCRHIMEKHCRTDYQYENSCTQIRPLILTFKNTVIGSLNHSTAAIVLFAPSFIIAPRHDRKYSELRVKSMASVFKLWAIYYIKYYMNHLNV